MKRTPSHELLDTDAGTPEEISGTLTDLRMFNRWFGGISCTTRLVDQVASDQKSLRCAWLDVAAALRPHSVHERFASASHLDITLLDRAASRIHNGTRAVVGMRSPSRSAMQHLISCPATIRFTTWRLTRSWLLAKPCVCRHAFVINDRSRTRFT
jgi:hypothetical protein